MVLNVDFGSKCSSFMLKKDILKSFVPYRVLTWIFGYNDSPWSNRLSVRCISMLSNGILTYGLGDWIYNNDNNENE